MFEQEGITIMNKSFIPILFNFLILTSGDEIGGPRPDVKWNYIHKFMSQTELRFYFAADSWQQVEENSYQVTQIVQNKPVVEKRQPNPDQHHVRLEIFGRNFELRLRRNRNLMYRRAEIIVAESDNMTRHIEYRDRESSSCHFLADSDWNEGAGDQAGPDLAAISYCGQSYQGYFTTNDLIYDIMPLKPRLQQFFADQHQFTAMNAYHLVKITNRTNLGPENKPGREEEQYDTKGSETEVKNDQNILRANPKLKIDWNQVKPLPKSSSTNSGSATGRRTKRADPTPLTIETAIFLDCTAYNLYKDFFDNDVNKYVDLVLTLVNGIQGIYNYPSLGRQVTFVIVHVEIHRKCLFNDHQGLRDKMLDNFCTFQQQKVDSGKKWDIALLFSGTDMYGINGIKSFGTMGLAPVTGICEPNYNCVIGEVGVLNERGGQYPSTGFVAVIVMAHEIGHNLGMNHDGTDNFCPTEGFIMSPSRGLAGECKWSDCSRRHIRNLNLACLLDQPEEAAISHHKYRNNPGLIVKANEQCQFLMKDEMARTVIRNHLSEICNSMMCESPRKDRPFSAGPALDGTHCGPGLKCYEGECVPRTIDDIENEEVQPQWSPWSHESHCRSNCISGSKGIRVRRRSCLTGVCEGHSEEVLLCDDPNFQDCPTVYQDAKSFADMQCANYKSASTRLDTMLTGSGEQKKFKESKSREKKGCQVHCFTYRDIFSVSADDLAAFNLNGKSRHFPDGTKCHQERDNYFCINGMCENSGQINKGGKNDESEWRPKELPEIRIASPDWKQNPELKNPGNYNPENAKFPID